jgi:hypothetical protein
MFTAYFRSKLEDPEARQAKIDAHLVDEAVLAADKREKWEMPTHFAPMK